MLKYIHRIVLNSNQRKPQRCGHCDIGLVVHSYGLNIQFLKTSKNEGLMDKIKKYAESLPSNCQKVYMDARVSKARAIKAKCHDCMGYEETVKRVRECATETCPLWPHRPHRVKR